MMEREYSLRAIPNSKSLIQRLDLQDLLVLLMLWSAICLIFWKTLHVGEFWWTDESRHAMNGVFFLDLWRDMPWRVPYEYALQYFAQYPALALNWYPPFFPVIESLFFAVFGITEFSARLTVFAFALAGATAWYAWVSPIWGRSIAILSYLLFLTAPGTIDWARSVMLEVPAITMIILSILVFDRYLDNPGSGRAAITGLVLGCMLLLKQTTVIILPVLLLYALASRRARLLWRREALWAYMIVGMVLILLLVHALKFGSIPVNALADQFGSNREQLFTVTRWALFWSALWQVCGWPLALVIIIGTLSLFLTRNSAARKPQNFLLFFWFVISCLFTTVVIGTGGYGNVPRYTMYALPPLALLACMPLSPAVIKNIAMRRSAVAFLALLTSWNIFAAWTAPHPYVSGYGQAAEFAAQQKDTGLILFAGKHDGNFIFHLRARDPEKNKAVVRADKILVSMAVQKSFGMVSYVHTKDDVIELIDRFGIGLIVIESRDVVDLPEFKLLTQTVNDPRFRLIKEIPISTNFREFSNLSVQIYRYLEKKEQRGDLVIPLPHMNMEIKLKTRTPQ